MFQRKKLCSRTKFSINVSTLLSLALLSRDSCHSFSSAVRNVRRQTSMMRVFTVFIRLWDILSKVFCSLDKPVFFSSCEQFEWFKFCVAAGCQTNTTASDSTSTHVASGSAFERRQSFNCGLNRVFCAKRVHTSTFQKRKILRIEVSPFCPADRLSSDHCKESLSLIVGCKVNAFQLLKTVNTLSDCSNSFHLFNSYAAWQCGWSPGLLVWVQSRWQWPQNDSERKCHYLKRKLLTMKCRFCFTTV